MSIVPLRWLVLLSFACGVLLLVGCGDVLTTPEGPRGQGPQFSGEDCPYCDPLTDAEWQAIQYVRGQIQLSDEAPDACADIFNSLMSMDRDDYGSFSGTYANGIHDPDGHGVPGEHIGIATAYLELQFGGEGLGTLLFHESAHHMGWDDYQPYRGLEGAYGAGRDCIRW